MDEITDELYNIGTSLGFSLHHTRGAIEKAENPSRLLKQWREWLKEEEQYLSASWPDYTSDQRRRMPGELPPMPESLEEVQERAKWLALALGKGAFRTPHRAPRKKNLRLWCVACGDRLRRAGLRHCSDKCMLLERDGCRR